LLHKKKYEKITFELTKMALQDTQLCILTHNNYCFHSPYGVCSVLN